jgi:hypothetical protein
MWEKQAEKLYVKENKYTTGRLWTEPTWNRISVASGGGLRKKRAFIGDRDMMEATWPSPRLSHGLHVSRKIHVVPTWLTSQSAGESIRVNLSEDGLKSRCSAPEQGCIPVIQSQSRCWACGCSFLLALTNGLNKHDSSTTWRQNYVV